MARTWSSPASWTSLTFTGLVHCHQLSLFWCCLCLHCSLLVIFQNFHFIASIEFLILCLNHTITIQWATVALAYQSPLSANHNSNKKITCCQAIIFWYTTCKVHIPGDHTVQKAAAVAWKRILRVLRTLAGKSGIPENIQIWDILKYFFQEYPRYPPPGPWKAASGRAVDPLSVLLRRQVNT